MRRSPCGAYRGGDGESSRDGSGPDAERTHGRCGVAAPDHDAPAYNGDASAIQERRGRHRDGVEVNLFAANLPHISRMHSGHIEQKLITRFSRNRSHSDNEKKAVKS